MVSILSSLIIITALYCVVVCSDTPVCASLEAFIGAIKKKVTHVMIGCFLISILGLSSLILSFVTKKPVTSAPPAVTEYVKPEVEFVEVPEFLGDGMMSRGAYEDLVLEWFEKTYLPGLQNESR